VVQGLLPEGLTILAGKSGAGKSFIAYQLALSLGWPDYQFLHRATADGPSLYLDLDGMDERQTAERLLPMAESQSLYVPPDFWILYEWPRFGAAGGMKALNAYLGDHPDTRLVVLDVLSELWADKGEGSIYHREYAQLSHLRKIAVRHHVAILALHHTSKSESDEPFDRISGSTAMQGATSCKWLLERRKGESKGKLHVSGKSVVDQCLHVTWDGEARWWSLLEDDNTVVI
jgi:RecA-family ATPase